MDGLATNLISPGVLFFGLGVFAARVRADVGLPDQVAQTLALYLMAAIGFKGGAELRQSGLQLEAFAALGAGLLIGMALPVIAYRILLGLGSVSRIDAAAISAHYGSVSLVTFGAAVAFLGEVDESTSGYMPAVLALMEAPAIAMGVALARRAGSEGSGDDVGPVRDALTSGSVLVLLGATVIGLILGARGLEDLDGFFVAPFTGALALFLLDMGLIAARRVGALRHAGWPLVAFGLYMPLIGAVLGAVLGTAIGMDVGDTALLATLSASASYIAAPAAMRIAVPEANPGLSLPLSIGVTFPFNLTLGIPLYLELARFLS